MVCYDLTLGFLFLLCLTANALASTAYTCDGTPSAQSVSPSKPAFYTTSNPQCAILCKANLTCTTYTLIGNQCYFKAVTGGPNCKLKTSATADGEAVMSALKCPNAGFKNKTVGIFAPCSRLSCNCGSEVCSFERTNTDMEWVPILTPFDCWVRCSLTSNCLSFSTKWPWCYMSYTSCTYGIMVSSDSLYCQCVA